MTDELTTRVAIVGAGLSGTLAACLLAEAGYDVSVYERWADPRADGFVGGRSINLALSARGLHALERAGLVEPVLTDSVPMRGRAIPSSRSPYPDWLWTQSGSSMIQWRPWRGSAWVLSTNGPPVVLLYENHPYLQKGPP